MDIKIVIIRLAMAVIFVLLSSLVIFLLIWFGRKKSIARRKEKVNKTIS